MAKWSDNDLERIGDADEIRIVTRHANGAERKPVIIWVVRVGHDLFVRSVKGREGDWYQGALERPDGLIRIGDDAWEVSFKPGDSGLGDAIDDAYRAKYLPTSPAQVPPIIAPSAAETTMRLIPAEYGG